MVHVDICLDQEISVDHQHMYIHPAHTMWLRSIGHHNILNYSYRHTNTVKPGGGEKFCCWNNVQNKPWDSYKFCIDLHYQLCKYFFFLEMPVIEKQL